MAFYQFLRSKNVPEEEVLRMEHEEIDGELAKRMPDEELKRYIAKDGHRLAIRFEYNVPRELEPPAERGAGRYSALIERINQRHRPDAAVGGSGNVNVTHAHAARPGNRNAGKLTRKVKLSWKNWDGKIFKQVRSNDGGGCIELTVRKTATCREILETCEKHYFKKDEKTSFGHLRQFNRFMADGAGGELASNLTLDDYYSQCLARPLRMYMHTKKITHEEGDSSLLSHEQSSCQSVEVPSVSADDEFENTYSQPKRTRRNLAEILGVANTSNSDALMICSTCFTTAKTSEGSCLRCQQDEELSASSKVDREKMDARRLEVKLETTLRQLREHRSAMAESEIPVGGEETINLKIFLPGGTVIKKTVAMVMPIQTLLMFIGAQDNSTPNFTVTCNSPRFVVNYDHNSTSETFGTLADYGLSKSACLMVRWIEWTENVLPTWALTATQSTEYVNVSSEQSTINDHHGHELVADSSDDELPDVFLEETNVTWFTLRRENIIGDLLDCFAKGGFDLRETTIRCKFENESAIDQGGVFRDALTHFWREFTDRYCEGNNQCVPILSLRTSRKFSLIGQILFKGFHQLRFFPLRLAKCFVVAGVLGFSAVSDEMLENCFLLSLARTDAEDIRSAMTEETISADLLPRVMDIVDRFKCSERPTSENIKGIVLACAEQQFLQQCRYAIEAMDMSQLKIFHEFRDVATLEATYESLTPTTAKVLSLIKVASNLTQREGRIYDFLIRCIKNFSDHLLLQFVRFVTGADCLLNMEIFVKFDHESVGLKTKFFAHVCSGELIIPVGFDNFNEFQAGLVNVLLADQWNMLAP